MTAYFNVHGEPLTLSARDAVVQLEPKAICTKSTLQCETWHVRRSSMMGAAHLGSGANEEAAWRDAWSRMLAASMERPA